ncbi:hypothetical protein ACKVMT_09905 [Halobacteriales archaeon Cl-PHB]
MADCPHCEREYADPTYLYRHVLTVHRDLILALWEREHGITPRTTGQQSLSGAVA